MGKRRNEVENDEQYKECIQCVYRGEPARMYKGESRKWR